MPIDFEYMDHVAIRVKSFETSAKWYKDLLSFEVANQWDNAWILRRGKIRLGIYLAADGSPVPDPQKRFTLHHFAFFVTPTQFIAAEVFLKDNKIPYDGPSDSGYFWSLFMTDPDGYRVELITDHSERIARPA